MALPRPIQPDLGLVESDGGFRVLEIILHLPPGPSDLDQIGQRAHAARGRVGVEVRDLARVGDGAADEQLAARVVGGNPRPVVVVAYFAHPGTSNGPTEAINGRLEHLRGSALGFRNLTNYIARSLLETGGFRPQLHPRS